MNQAIYHAYNGEIELALTHLKEFASEEDFHYWTILFVKIDPILEEVLKIDEAKKTLEEIEKRFWFKHERITNTLDKGDLIRTSKPM
jgi:hypothetical protein